MKTQASFIGGLVGSGSDVAGSERLNIPQASLIYEHVNSWISHQCNELKEAFNSLAAGIAAKYVLLYLCL